MDGLGQCRRAEVKYQVPTLTALIPEGRPKMATGIEPYLANLS